MNQTGNSAMTILLWSLSLKTRPAIQLTGSGTLVSSVVRGLKHNRLNVLMKNGNFRRRHHAFSTFLL